MFAKLVGAITAVAVFMLYFWWRGTDPMFEVALGFLLTLAAGVWAWWATDRRLRQAERRPPPGDDRRYDPPDTP